MRSGNDPYTQGRTKMKDYGSAREVVGEDEEAVATRERGISMDGVCECRELVRIRPFIKITTVLKMD